VPYLIAGTQPYFDDFLNQAFSRSILFFTASTLNFVELSPFYQALQKFSNAMVVCNKQKHTANQVPDGVLMQKT